MKHKLHIAIIQAICDKFVQGCCYDKHKNRISRGEEMLMKRLTNIANQLSKHHKCGDNSRPVGD